MEAKKLDERIVAVEKKSLGATESMLRTVTETEGIADNVTVKLKVQGEQLRRAHNHTADIDENLIRAEQHLSTIERPWWCCCFDWVVGKRRSAVKRMNTNDKVKYPIGRIHASRSGESRPMIKTVTGSEMEMRIDQNLRQTEHVMANLKHQVLEMGHELDDQSRQLDIMNEESEGVIVNLRADRKRVQKLL